jgi:hypothetical protein
VDKRGEYWQFRMWLAKENKYARKSLCTRTEITAVEHGKADGEARHEDCGTHGFYPQNQSHQAAFSATKQTDFR